MLTLWMINPFIFWATCVLLFFFKSDVLNVIPNVTFLQSFLTPSAHSVKLPGDPATIIALYQIYLDKGPDMLAKASKLLHYTFNSAQQLTELIEELKITTAEVIQSRGVLGKFWGMMSFVNFLWLVSIIGIVITFYPAMSKIIGPIIEHLVEGLRIIARQLWKYREELSYPLLSLLLIQSFHCHVDIGFYFALLALFAYFLLFAHTLHVHAKQQPTEEGRLFITAMTFIPTCSLTILYESQLTGFLSVAIIYAYLGFSVISAGLSWFIGFKDKSSLHHSKEASLLIIPMYFLLTYQRVLNTQNNNEIEFNINFFKFFHYGVYAFAVVAYFLALLIQSSVLYYPRVYAKGSNETDYDLAQIVMTLSLNVGLFIGFYFNISSLSNVSMTFTFLYLSEKICEMDVWKEKKVVLVFLGFVATFCVSLWLNTHPAFVKAILQGS